MEHFITFMSLLQTSSHLTISKHNSKVCHPRCVWKANGELISARKHNYNYILDDIPLDKLTLKTSYDDEISTSLCNIDIYKTFFEQNCNCVNMKMAALGRNM